MRIRWRTNSLDNQKLYFFPQIQEEAKMLSVVVQLDMQTYVQVCDYSSLLFSLLISMYTIKKMVASGAVNW